MGIHLLIIKIFIIHEFVMNTLFFRNLMTNIKGKNSGSGNGNILSIVILKDVKIIMSR